MLWLRSIVEGFFPTLLYSHSSTLVGDNVLVFGGRDGREAFASLYVLNIPRMVWEQPDVSGPLPSPRAFHSATFVANKRMLVIIGGSDLKNSLGGKDVAILNTETFEWMLPAVNGQGHRGDIPTVLVGHTATLLDDGQRILVLGGKGNGNRISILDLDTMTWSTVEPKNMKKGETLPYGHGTVYCDGHVYIFGGNKAGTMRGESARNSLFSLNTDTWEWKRLNVFKTPSPRAYFVSCLINEKEWLVYGGSRDSSSSRNDVHVLHLGSMTWSRLTPGGSNVKRRQHLGSTGTLYTVRGRSILLMVGGSAETMANFVHILDLQASTSGSISSPFKSILQSYSPGTLAAIHEDEESALRSSPVNHSIRQLQFDNSGNSPSSAITAKSPESRSSFSQAGSPTSADGRSTAGSEREHLAQAVSELDARLQTLKVAFSEVISTVPITRTSQDKETQASGLQIDSFTTYNSSPKALNIQQQSTEFSNKDSVLSSLQSGGGLVRYPSAKMYSSMVQLNTSMYNDFRQVALLQLSDRMLVSGTHRRRL